MESTNHSLHDYLNEFSRELSLLIALLAITGSLMASEVFGWSTFTLSTLQRIFMYPLVPIIGSSLYFDVRNLRKYVIPLTSLGMTISAYHHLLIRLDPTRGCGFALPCTTLHRYTIASITLQPMYLPLLAFIAFALITALTWQYEPK